MADSEERIEDRPAAPAPEGEGGDAVTGPEAIARYVKHLGRGPGVYRMIDAAGEVLYVGKARNLKKRVQNYARLAGHTNRIAAMIARHGVDGVRHHRDRVRGAAARSQSHQALQAALQRAAARRQIVSLHPHPPRPCGAADR